MVILRLVNLVSPYCYGMLGRLSGVWCSVWRQGAVDRRAKGLKARGTRGKEGCEGKVAGLPAVPGEFGVSLGCFVEVPVLRFVL